MRPKVSHFGHYLRKKRVAAKLSLRDVADRMDISHVYLGEVERGVRGPLKRERWPDLARAVPGISVATLERLSETSKPVQLDLSDRPPEYRSLAFALARRLERADLSSDQIRSIMRTLGEENDEEG